VSDTLSEKSKKSAVINQTILFTVTVLIVITLIIFSLRVIVASSTLKTYSNIIINQISAPTLSIRSFNQEKTPENNLENGEKSVLDFLERLIKSNNTIANMILSNKIVILDEQLISDPYGIINSNFKIQKSPFLYKDKGLYYIFVEIPAFQESKLIIGGPSFEYTAFIQTFDKISIFMIFVGLFFSLIVSYFLAKRTLKPIICISKTISGINVDSLEKRIPEQEYFEFHVLAIKLNSMLERIQYAYDNQKQFVSDVSHELRTPLTSINGYVKMLKRWGAKDEDILNESIYNIEKSAEYLKDMVEKLLILTKPEFEPELVEVSIYSVLKDLLEMYRKDNILINIYGKDFTVQSSEKYLSIILKTIIENAIKYSPYEKRIDITLENNIINIKDYGIGIEQEKLEKVFERFYKVDTSRTDKSHGLGLSIAKKLSDKLNIDISVNSKVNEGTVFTLRFKEFQSEE